MSSNQARGWRSPPVHKNKIVLRRTDGHSSSVRLPPFAPYPSTGHSSVGRDVFSYETPPLLTCLRLTRAFSLSTSRACNKVHVEDGSHRVDIRPTSGSLTLQSAPPLCSQVRSRRHTPGRIPHVQHPTHRQVTWTRTESLTSSTKPSTPTTTDGNAVASGRSTP